MRIQRNVTRDCSVLIVSGRIDGEGAQALEAELQAIVSQQGVKTIYVNLDGAALLCSMAVAHFLRARTQMRRRGGDLWLREPSEEATETLRLAGIYGQIVEGHLDYETLRVKIQKNVSRDSCDLTVSGRIDGEGAQALEAELQAIVSQQSVKTIWVHLSEATFLCSRGVGVLMRARTQVRQRRGELWVKDPSEAASETLRFAGIYDLIVWKN